MIKYFATFGIIVVLIIGSLLAFFFWLSKEDADYVWKKLNDDKMTSSLVFNENGETKTAIHSDQLMSLASTVKIIVALEYAYQVEENKVNAEEKIDLKELEKYYVPKLDGGAHEAWLDYIKENGQAQGQKVSLREVTRGMIAFSSNANTEFLMRKLKVENMEQRLKELHIQNHTPLFFFTSALFMPYELKMKYYPNKPMKEVKEQIIQKIRKMDDEKWIQLSTEINEELTINDTYQKDINIAEWWDSDFDLLFSDTFIKSTTSEYAKIMAFINNEKLPPIAQKEMEYVLGMIMENETNQQWLKRAGKKGGSTNYILTDAMFAEDKQGNKFEIVLFFNDLKWYEGWKLSRSLNEFELKLLQEESFREKISH